MTNGILGNQYIKDALVIILMIAFYNFYISIAYDSIQHINLRKVAWGFITGGFIFIPMYFILWATLRKMKSELLFFLASFSTWIIQPFIISQNVSQTFNAWQGKRQIFENGQLTIYGYFHWLQNPFFFLVVYAGGVYMFHLYRKLQGHTGGDRL